MTCESVTGLSRLRAREVVLGPRKHVVTLLTTKPVYSIYGITPTIRTMIQRSILFIYTLVFRITVTSKYHHVPVLAIAYISLSRIWCFRIPDSWVLGSCARAETAVGVQSDAVCGERSASGGRCALAPPLWAAPAACGCVRRGAP